MSINVTVSIVIPVYNSEKFLEKTIKSILCQTYRALEIIFINDGSSDKSLDILQKYSRIDKRVNIISIENSGPATARNIGIDHATGKYICFFDSDDYVEPDTIESLLKVAENKNADLVICGYFLEKVTEDNYKKTKIKVPSNFCFSIENKSELFSQLYKEGMINTLWNKMFKLETIRKNKIKFDIELFYSEDINFVIDFFKYADNITIINKPYYHFIRRKNYQSLSKRYHHQQELIFEKVINNMKQLFNIIGNTEKSQETINSRIAQKAVTCISNLVHPNCPLNFDSKQRRIEKILNDETVKAIKSIKPQNRFQKIVFPILKTRNSLLIYFSFKLLRLIRYYI